MAIATALGLKKDATPEKMKKAFDALVSLAGAMADEEMPVAAITEEVVDAACKPVKMAELSRIANSLRKLSGIALQDDVAMVEEAVSEGMPETEELVEEASEAAATMVLSKLVEATGMDEAGVLAAVTEKLDQIAAMLVAGPVSGMTADANAQLSRTSVELSAHKARAVELAATVKGLQAQVAELSKEREQRVALERTARIEASFARLLGEGRVTEAQRVAFVAASEQSEQLALDIYSALPATAQPPTGSLVTGPKAPTNSLSLSASQDPIAKIFEADAKAAGLRGEAAKKHVAVMLSKHAARNSGA
jgi:hypothetical protein